MEVASLKNVSILTDQTNFTERPSGPVSAVCLVGECANDASLKNVLHGMQINILESETGEEFTDQDDIAFIVDDFRGSNFQRLWELKKAIYGPTAVKESAVLRKELSRLKRPLYCYSMDEIVACFSGFKNTALLEELVNLIHYMGGSVRKKYTAKVTHLIAATTQGEKYRLAVGAGIPVMSEQWIRKAWEKRSIMLSYAFSEEMKIYKLPAFYRLRLAFHGFSHDDAMAMQVHGLDLGAEITDPSVCTHYIINVDRAADKNGIPEKPNDFCHLVTAEWFWTSAHLYVCANELEYSPQKRANNPVTSPPVPDSRANSSTLSVLYGKQRRSFDRSRLSVLDASNDASCVLADHMFSADDLEGLMRSPPKRGSSKRLQICMELLQTESNYVQILRTIVMVFKEPLEKLDPFGNQLINSAEIKMIFGNIPEILTVHQNIRASLSNLILNWDEGNCVGRVWVENADELMKCYPPFVNFFEDAKQTLSECAQKNPRFQAFLKACQSKPECSRQSLKELLIRPVQRLPSVVLLLTDLLKHTDKSHKDSQCLQQAITDLKRVINYLNENKRRTDGQKQMFDIVQAIDGCPADLLSSQRELIAEIEVTDLSGTFCKKTSSVLVFYLFNDCLEIAKKVQKSSKDTVRSPSQIRGYSKTKVHKELILLTKVRRVINVTGCHEGSEVFCLTIRSDLSDCSYAFTFLGYSGRRTSTGSSNSVSLAENKKSFLRQLCDYVVMATGRSGFDFEDYDAQLPDDHDLGPMISKAIGRIKTDSNSLVRRSMSLKTAGRSSTNLRRAVSHAVMGTLRRMSRSNLRIPLHEIVEETAANMSKGKTESSLMICD